VYRKLGAHSRQEAVQRARAIGLLAGSAGLAGSLERVTTGRSDKRT
jgi:hypothetical protein